MDVLTVSFDEDKWTVLNLIDLGEELNSEQRIKMCDVLQRYAQILKELELEHSNVPDSEGQLWPSRSYTLEVS